MSAADFTSAEFLDALTPPRFTVGGHTYTGIILSEVEWLKLQRLARRYRDAALAAPAPTTDDEADRGILALGKLTLDVAAACFPISWWDRVRSWLRLRHTAIEAFATFPFGPRQALMYDFLARESRAQMVPGTSSATPPSTTGSAENAPKPSSAPSPAASS
jgi:hypothetical protein